MYRTFTQQHTGASAEDTMATKYLLDISASKGTYLTEEKLSQRLHSTNGVERRFKVSLNKPDQMLCPALYFCLG